MEFVGILRVLWRYRLLVALSVIPAVAIALVLGHARYTVGAGTASALVDTYRSQTVDLGAQTGSDIQTLAARANLLAGVMTSSPIKDDIARSAGIRPDRLISLSSTVAGPGPAQPPTVNRASTTISASVPQLQSGVIPFIVVKTRAPTAALARRIADASFLRLIAGLGTVAGNDHVSHAHRLVVRRLGAATSETEHKGVSMLGEIAVAIAVFVALCLMILGVHALVDGWRRAEALERGALDGRSELHAEAGSGDAPDPHQSSLFDQEVSPRDANDGVLLLEPTPLADAEELPASPANGGSSAVRF